MTTASPALADWLAHRATTTADRVALVAGGRTWRFAELHMAVARVVRGLAALGVRPGDRVATLLHNGPAPVLLAHAALRLGATLVPLNVRLSGVELAWQLADARPQLLVVDGRTAPVAERARGELPALATVTVDVTGTDGLDGLPPDGAGAHDVGARLEHDPVAVAAIIYTSGTTGRPKGAMLTVGNFWWSAVGSALNLGLREDDRWLACLPLFHVGGLSIVHRSAIYGIAAVVHESFDADAANRAIDDDRVTIVSVVAVMLQRMLDARGDRPYPPTLRCVLLGGGAAPRALLERCAAIGVPVVQTYGLTETTSQVATLAPEDALRRLGSAGRALYPNEIDIVGDDGRRMPRGEPGEIIVRGPIVTAGYLDRPDATAAAIVDGWLHTGDIGSLDAEGFLYVHDRRDDLIVRGGENVYPAEVEAVLLAHASIAEAGVFGVPDVQWGHRAVAVVRLHDGTDAREDAPAELQGYCRSRLAGYKVPSEIRIVTDPLPRTASGKVRRGELRTRTLSPSD